MIKFETLAQQAVEAGYADNVEVRLATKTEMVRQFLRDRFESEESFPVTDEEILARYEKDPGRFQRPERVRASHIMVSDRNQAEEVLSKLREKVAEPGTNARRVFREFVRAYSQDEVTKKRGGDLLYFGRDGATDGDGSVDPAVVAAAFSMYNTDQVSGVVRGSRGYHILLVTHRRDKVDRSLEAAAEELRQELRAEKQEEARRKFLEDVVNEDAWHIETSVLSSVTVDGVPDSSSLKARVKSIEETGETE
jgi:parvulin-like peptidyl-prolyl isomerase